MNDLRRTLEAMSDDELAALAGQLQQMGPVATFPWHEQQVKILQAATNVVVAIGGNQSGKTTVGRGAVSRLVRREGPVYRRLRNPHRPLKVWVSPQTLEKFKSNWEKQLITEVFSPLGERDRVWRYVQAPHPVFTWVDEYTTWEKPNELWGKSCDQGFLSFESDVVDLIVFDEEPEDRRIYSSAVARLSTTNGIILFTFTPLQGLSWTHSEFYRPTVHPDDTDEDVYKVSDRHWRRGNAITLVQMGMADNPSAVEGGGVARIASDPGMSEAEKQTRLYGEYGYTEGMIFPQLAGITPSDPKYQKWFLDALPADRLYRWAILADPNKQHGALLTASDFEGNTYVVAEHFAQGLPDRLHAAGYRSLALPYQLSFDTDIEVWADPGGAGSQAIINLADLGIIAGAVPKGAGSVKASIELIRRALSIDRGHPHPTMKDDDGRRVMGAPHLYFLRGLTSSWKVAGYTYRESRLLWELRQYRQKESAAVDTPVKEHDDLVDCLRYHYLVRMQNPDAPPDTTDSDAKAKLDPLSLRATLEYEELVKQASAGRRVRDPHLGSI